MMISSPNNEKIITEFQEKIALLKTENAHFKKLAHEYDEANHAVHRVESGAEVTTDEHLNELRKQLELEFGVDLWEKSLEKQRGNGTTEDLYFWYKNQVGQTYTKSELKMRGII